jgi:hypothetical protein
MRNEIFIPRVLFLQADGGKGKQKYMYVLVHVRLSYYLGEKGKREKKSKKHT